MSKIFIKFGLSCPTSHIDTIRKIVKDNRLGLFYWEGYNHSIGTGMYQLVEDINGKAIKQEVRLVVATQAYVHYFDEESKKTLIKYLTFMGIRYFLYDKDVDNIYRNNYITHN